MSRCGGHVGVDTLAAEVIHRVEDRTNARIVCNRAEILGNEGGLGVAAEEVPGDCVVGVEKPPIIFPRRCRRRIPARRHLPSRAGHSGYRVNRLGANGIDDVAVLIGTPTASAAVRPAALNVVAGIVQSPSGVTTVLVISISPPPAGMVERCSRSCYRQGVGSNTEPAGRASLSPSSMRTRTSWCRVTEESVALLSKPSNSPVAPLEVSVYVKPW